MPNDHELVIGFQGLRLSSAELHVWTSAKGHLDSVRELLNIGIESILRDRYNDLLLFYQDEQGAFVVT